MFLLKHPCEISSGEFAHFIEEYRVHDKKLYPATLDKDSSDFPKFVKCLKDEPAGINQPQGYVPGSSYFTINQHDRIFGCVNIRHELSEYQKNFGGHIGFRIGPKERNRGLGYKQHQLSLLKMELWGMKRILAVCEKDNQSSAQVIKKNGGKLESGLIHDNEVIQRFWITL